MMLVRDAGWIVSLAISGPAVPGGIKLKTRVVVE